ncbi:terminase gpA endonuclease subunit [Desulfovibrio oxyclinae]|uniref:terminase gpA endonuclease subunit n=1 Tax=Desulfovibrio oxyclinae TaxID=63560 RepID=UPI000A036E45|nr:terminase gpA endonuclease subunit [Desulfovibrio oxyclinae]
MQNDAVIHVSSRWLPHGVDVERYQFQPSKAERRICRKRKPIKPSIWAERHRVLPEDSALPGRWRNSTSPYLTGILDASYTPGVRELVLCAAPQVGKTEVINTVLGYAIDRDPGPAMLVYPDRPTATHNIKNRIRSLLESTPRLAGFMTGREDDVANTRINLEHMSVYGAWATPSSLANKFIKHLIFDEIDKYPAVASKSEADPISLGEKRQRTFRWSRKRYKISSPTIESGPIWQELQSCQIVFHYIVRCPSCGGFQRMNTKGHKFPEDERDPATIENKLLARYECEHCKAHWDDNQRDKAVALGEWRDLVSGATLEAVLKERRPAKIGFHIPAWLSRFVSLSEVAAAFLKGQASKQKMRDYCNAYEAEPWVEYHVERPLERIKVLKDERPAGVVPGGGVVAGLTAAVDTQDNGFWYEVRAWGWGLQRESWGIREGFVLCLEDVARILWDERYSDADGNEYNVELAVIDSGGHRTSEVYDWARTHRGRVYAYKGEQRMNKPHDFTTLEYMPPDKRGRKRSIPGGLRLLRGNSNFYKDRLSSQLEIAPADPGAWHLHGDVTDDWCKQMTVEYVDDNGNWQCPKGKDNHAWDCGYMNLVAAAVKRMEFRKPGERLRVKTKKQKRKKINPYTGEEVL